MPPASSCSSAPVRYVTSRMARVWPTCFRRGCGDLKPAAVIADCRRHILDGEDAADCRGHVPGGDDAAGSNRKAGQPCGPGCRGSGCCRPGCRGPLGAPASVHSNPLLQLFRMGRTACLVGCPDEVGPDAPVRVHPRPETGRNKIRIGVARLDDELPAPAEHGRGRER